MPNKKLEDINLDKVCRTCLSECDDMKTLTKTIIDNLMEVTSVNLAKIDGLPNSICIPCFRQLNRFFSFKKRVEKCETKLLKLVKKRSKQTTKKTSTFTDLYGDVNVQIIHSSQSNVKDDNKSSDIYEVRENIQLDSQNIYLNEPPPLVPLVPIAPEEIPDFPPEERDPKVEVALRPISDETPPLVPIKPIVGVDPLTAALAISDILSPKYSCPICIEEFTDPITLKYHVSTYHSNSNVLTCSICRKEFADRNRLIRHLKGHTVQKLYVCKICTKRYPNPSTFKVHMRTHTGERPFKCQVCGKGFIRWAGVVGHMKTHDAAKPFQCDICQRGFKMPANLERHKILHTGEMPYCCSYCGKTFTQNDNLQLHIRTYHTHERPYLCSECGKSFVSSTRLKRHMWVHTGFKRYSCKSCPKTYSNANDLKHHISKTHTGEVAEADKPYACETCHMRFFHPCRLAKHLKTHDRRFTCNECSKTFPSEEAVARHMEKKHPELISFVYSGTETEILVDDVEIKYEIVQ